MKGILNFFIANLSIDLAVDLAGEDEGEFVSLTNETKQMNIIHKDIKYIASSHQIFQK
jgi:hypothetical protein